jgi:hypothetical protein
MIVNKMGKATEYTEFTEKKDISSEFSPSGAAGPHPAGPERRALCGKIRIWQTD